MSSLPILVLVHGSWHTGACFNPLITLLNDKYGLKCTAPSLPSTSGNPDATFKDDIDTVRATIAGETCAGRDVVVIAHSYGGIVGSSAIKGFARPRPTKSPTAAGPATGHVIGFILIASGCNLTGLAFMDPFFGHPPPSWRVNKDTGYAELVVPPAEFFYHDMPADEQDYWVSQLTSQSLKALFEGGEHSYTGWMDVPVWYIGTVEDRGLPVAAQRLNVGMARAMGGNVEHREILTSHSPFLSQPEETAGIVVEAIGAFTGKVVKARTPPASRAAPRRPVTAPAVRLLSPLSWYRYGLPYFFGRLFGNGILLFGWCRRFFGTSK
ncbi:Alpha/beta hydrolase family domain containing protein [Rhypophila decipiens]